MEESKEKCVVKKKIWLNTYSWTTWISKEGIIDVTNATFEEAKTTLKKIASPHAFVENEQWNVVHMKEKFHARFAIVCKLFTKESS
jgi:hypothetical protein